MDYQFFAQFQAALSQFIEYVTKRWWKLSSNQSLVQTLLFQSRSFKTEIIYAGYITSRTLSKQR